MKFIDPSPAHCESCGTADLYPVNDLLRYEQVCSACGSLLVESALSMNQAQRSVALEAWPVSCFFWDACSMIDLDLDAITDQEFENVVYIRDFKKLLRQQGHLSDIKIILEFPCIQAIKGCLVLERLEEYSLKDLALMAVPERLPS